MAEEYSLASQSLFLAVAYLDRFLSKQSIDRSRLQLVGVTSLLLSAKYWEIYPPAIDEFVYISDSTYTKAEVLAMENALLTTLKFKLTSPTSWEFSRRFCKAANADKQTETLVDVSITQRPHMKQSANQRGNQTHSNLTLFLFSSVSVCAFVVCSTSSS